MPAIRTGTSLWPRGSHGWRKTPPSPRAVAAIANSGATAVSNCTAFVRDGIQPREMALFSSVTVNAFFPARPAILPCPENTMIVSPGERMTTSSISPHPVWNGCLPMRDGFLLDAARATDAPAGTMCRPCQAPVHGSRQRRAWLGSNPFFATQTTPRAPAIGHPEACQLQSVCRVAFDQIRRHNNPS